MRAGRRKRTDNARMAQYRPLGHHSNNSNGTSSADHVSIGIRNTTSHGKLSRPRRSARLDKAGCSLSVASVSVFLSLVLLVTLLAYFYISGYNTLVHTDNKGIILLIVMLIFLFLLIFFIYIMSVAFGS